MLTIKAERISVIKKEFNDLFPFLKLEFFKQPHVTHEGNARLLIIAGDMLLKSAGRGRGEIVINEHTPVSVLEKLFFEVFGISAQVFRKSGNIWLETTITDDWTLGRQNTEGQELSTFTR